MASSLRTSVLAACFAVLAGGCSVNKTEPPPPTGPSELATSLSLFANPDTLTQDGASQAQIVIQARDANGQPLRNLALRAEIAAGGAIQDFGKLSAKNIATGNDGRAVVTYTAPAAVETVDRQTVVSVLVTPVGTDANGARARSVSIRLVPPGVITPPEGIAPGILIDPAGVSVLQTATFSPDFGVEGALPESQVSQYDWDFGDGSSAGTKVATHQYRTAGVYGVSLTVTTAAGISAKSTRSLTVGAGTPPTASFVFSPAAPGIGEEVIFNASASSAEPPRTIVSYDWQFGTDETASGVIVGESYDTAGTYNVTLTVTDDAGNVATVTQSVNVGTASPGGLQASFTFSPTAPTAGQTIFFNAGGSTSAAQIVEYQWDFGDGTTSTTASPTRSHVYAAAGTYIVTLRIEDSAGLTTSTTQTVTVE